MNRSAFIRRSILAVPLFAWLAGKQSSAGGIRIEDGLLERVKRLEELLPKLDFNKDQIKFDTIPVALLSVSSNSAVKIEVIVHENNPAVPFVVYACSAHPNVRTWIEPQQVQEAAKWFENASRVRWNIDTTGVLTIQNRDPGDNLERMKHESS